MMSSTAPRDSRRPDALQVWLVARENEATAGTPDGLGTEELGLRQRGDPGGFPLRGTQPHQLSDSVLRVR